MTTVIERLSVSLADRYRIERVLGAGGMATVYLAEDLKHHRQVALKVLRPELSALLGVQRFLEEIRVTANLQHPHLLPLFDSGEADGLLYYVMPCVEGESLRSRLTRERRLDIGEATRITTQVASALDYAHRHGVVHRDVKPENILLHEGEAVVADFGIALAVSEAGGARLTETGMSLGTPHYMSPEQATGDQAVDGRSDVYSLGAVLYEMLAGEPPHNGPSSQAVIAKLLVQQPTSLRILRDTVPHHIDTAVARALAKTRADRFPTAGAFASALGVTGAAGAEVGPGLRAIRERPAVRTVAIAAVVLALGLGLTLARGAFTPRVELDRNRVMIFPLVVSTGFPGSPSVGEDVATVIGTTLDGIGPLRWIDGWTHLDARLRQSIRELTASEARSIARAQRCAFYVTGNVVPRGADSALISLTLFDVRQGSETKRSSAAAPLGQAWRGVQAVSDLLPQLIPGVTPIVLAEWEDRPPQAIAGFLLGEAAFRRIRLDEALAQYRAAVAADSSFAFAALRGAQAASWSHRNEEAAALVGAAMRQSLPPRHAAFARGYQAYLEGRADSAIAAFRAALAIDAEMAATWLQLGETWTHLLPLAGATEDSALHAFQQVLRIDSVATNALFHPIEILIRRSDVAGAEPLVRRLIAADPAGTYADEVRIMLDCARRSADGMPWDDIARERPFPLLAAASQLSGGGTQLSCAAAGFSALLRVDTAGTDEAASRRFFALLGLQNVRLAQGREDLALAAVDSFFARWGAGASLFLLAAPYYPGYTDRARAVAREDAARYGPAYGRLPFDNRLWELGVLEARLGDRGVAAAVAAELRKRAASEPTRVNATRAASIDAHIALAAGDTSLALRRLADLMPPVAPGDALRYDEARPLAGERLEYARLLVARGEYGRAIDVADVLDSPWPVVHLLYLAPSLRLRASAAAALGDTRRANQFRARLEALRGQSPVRR